MKIWSQFLQGPVVQNSKRTRVNHTLGIRMVGARGGAKRGPAGAMAPLKAETQTRELYIYSLNFMYLNIYTLNFVQHN
jgi:hypothetical protein